QGNEVDWYHVVWSRYSIPRHVIHIWLIMRKGLLTYSSHVWKLVLNMADIHFVSCKWSDVVGWLMPMAKKNNTTSIVGCLIVTASSYFLWKECYNMVHGKDDRKPEEVSKVIVDTVRLKLASIQFNKTVRVVQMRRTWKLPSLLSDEG
ncbi:hypothetical protein Tco_0238408, partial [Tanacetum coccineum]